MQSLKGDTVCPRVVLSDKNVFFFYPLINMAKGHCAFYGFFDRFTNVKGKCYSRAVFVFSVKHSAETHYIS